MDSSLTHSLYRQAQRAGQRGYIVVGTMTALAYALTASPDLYWRDSGELAAAGFSMAIPHPTGFPIYVMLVRAASLVPLGSIAFRIALLSALCAAVAVGLVYKLVEEMLVAGSATVALRRFGAFGASVSMASVELFWRTGTVPEVYAATSALLAAGLLLFWRMLFRPRPQTALAGLFLAGLASVGLHSTLRWNLVLPWLILWGWYLARTKARWPKLAGALFVLGAGCLVQLPIRSHLAPAMDWGHPSTFGGLWEHVTGWRIRTAFASQMLTTNRVWFLHDIKAFLFLIWDQTLGLWPILVVVGFVAALRRANWRMKAVRTMALLLAWILLTDFVYGFWVNPMGMEDLQNGFALLLAGSVLVGLGLVATASFLAQSLPALAVASSAVLVFITILPPAISNWQAKTKGTDWGAGAWSRAALAQALPGALVVVESDDLAAGLSYLRVAEDARPDLVVVVAQHAWDALSLRRVLAASRWPAPVQDLVGDWSARSRRARMKGSVAFLQALVQSFVKAGRQVLWEPSNGPEAKAAGALLPGTPLFLVAGSVSIDLRAATGAGSNTASQTLAAKEPTPDRPRIAARPRPVARPRAATAKKARPTATASRTSGPSRAGADSKTASAGTDSAGPPGPGGAKRALRRPAKHKPEQVAARVIQQTTRTLYGQESAVTRRTGARHLTSAGSWAFEMATVLRRRRDFPTCMAWTDAAIMLFHAALKFRLNHAPALINLGAALSLRAQLLRKAGDVQRSAILLGRALSAVEMGLADKPLSKAGLLNAAKFSLLLAQWSHRQDLIWRARRHLIRAWKAGFHDAEIAFTLGVVDANLANMDQAARWFERALKANPRMKAAKIYLDRLRGRPAGRPGKGHKPGRRR